MWPDSQETQGLLDRVEREGDAAEDELWARHREPLRVLIARRLDHGIEQRVDASDVVQDVLLKASRRLSEYLRDPVMPFHLWLRRLALDQLIDAHRRHRGAARRSINRERPMAVGAYSDRSSFDLAAQLRDPGITPAAAALRQELQRRFQEAIGQLDEADREILLMRHFEQLSNGDAACALGLSEAAAGMRHLRALRRLRALLDLSPSQGGGL